MGLLAGADRADPRLFKDGDQPVHHPVSRCGWPFGGSAAGLILTNQRAVDAGADRHPDVDGASFTKNAILLVDFWQSS